MSIKKKHIKNDKQVTTGFYSHCWYQIRENHGWFEPENPVIRPKIVEIMPGGPNTKSGRPAIALTAGRSPSTDENGGYVPMIDPVP